MPKNSKKVQYTIRNIPSRVDRTLKQRARESGKSFNQVALEALLFGTGESLLPKRDFSQIIGSMSDQEAAKIEKEVRMQHQIDESLWK